MIFKQELSPQNGRYTPLLCFHLDENDFFYNLRQNLELYNPNNSASWRNNRMNAFFYCWVLKY